MPQLLSNLPVGSKVKDSRTTFLGNPIVFVIIDKNHAGYPLNSVTLLTDKVITHKAYDGKEPTNGNTNRKNYGNDRYMHSNVRQWLNKEGTSWYVAQHGQDAPPSASNVYNGNPYDNEVGFLSNFSPELKGRLLITTLVSARSTAVDGGGSDTFQDKVFLLSATEVGFGLNNGIAEGQAFSFFNSNASRQTLPTAESITALTNPQNYNKPDMNAYWRLRSPYIDGTSAHSTRLVNGSGQTYFDHAHNTTVGGIRPVINVPADILVSDSVGEDGAYVILWNEPPTLTLTSPTDNLTLAEGNQLPVEGSATDPDVGDVVTIRYKINNGTTRALNSGVSDGSSPLSFAKTLTYSSKRIWDGSTDVAGADLAENTNHTLTVWSEDDQGGKSAEDTRTFKVIWNRPPAIDGSDTNLGAIGTAPSINYTVTEPEGDSFTITEFLNGQQLRSFAGVAGQQNTATIDQDRWLRLALGVQHELRIRATDSKGQFADRIYTFTRTETQIQFDLKNPFFCDAKPTRVLVTLDGTFPDGSTLLVEVCNNAYDAVPTYEDATGPSLAGRGYIFTNETKTAADWGINIRITINRGTATEKVILNGFGGAFD